MAWLALWVALVPAAGLTATVVRVGVYSNPPKVVTPIDAPPSGIYVNALESTARAEDYAIQYVPGTFQQGLERLSGGEIDLLVDVAKTADRERLFDFTQEPVLQSWSQVYARPGSGIRNLLHLNGKHLAVLQGSVQEKFFLDAVSGFRVNATLLRFPSFDDAFAAVRSGEADAVIANPFYGELSRSGLEDTAIIFAPSTLHFAARKGANPALLAALDRQLALQKADPGSVYSRDFRRLVSTQPAERIPDWVAWAGLLGLLFLVLALGWAVTIRRAATKLRHLEAGQRRISEELQRVFDSSLDLICVLDANLRFLRVSGSATRWGWTPEELRGKSCLDILAPADRERAGQALHDTLAGTEAGSLIARTLRKDGSVAHTTWSAVWSPVQGEMYCVAHDESEQVSLMTALRQQNHALELANRDLELVGYSLSHDLRSPVHAITGFVGRVLETSRGILPPDGSRLLERSLAAGQRIDQMVQDLAAMLRVAGEPLSIRSCDVSNLVLEVVQSARDGACAAPRVRVEPGLMADADPRLLRMALENLISNACKFSARASAPLIEVGRIGDHGESAFFIRDNGVGFDMEYAGKLFLPFSRLHSQTDFPGSGMGLSIVQRVITRHGGRIWAEAQPGQGSTFYFTLPRAPRRVVEHAKADSGPPM